MHVNRRTVIKQFLFVSAGVTLLPACLHEDKGKSSILLKNFQADRQQEKTLAELTETIIPATSTPGAAAISAHLFVLKMLDDCYKKEDQQKFMKGMDQFEKTVLTKYDRPFYKCSKPERESILSGINGKKDLPDELSFFYSTTKRLTIQVYSTSKFYLTKLQVYKMIPGKYKGCIPVKNDLTKTS